MSTMPLEQADHALTDFIDRLPPGEDVVLTRGGTPIATIRATVPEVLTPRRLGTLKGSIVAIARDFDDVPDGFEDYLP